jgi:hypothetical protein
VKTHGLQPSPPILLYRPVHGHGTLRMHVFYGGKRIGEIHQRSGELEFQREGDWWPVLQSASFGTLSALIPMIFRNDLRREGAAPQKYSPGYAPVLKQLAFQPAQTRH